VWLIPLFSPATKVMAVGQIAERVIHRFLVRCAQGLATYAARPAERSR
jgi:hypothetical protein